MCENSTETTKAHYRYVTFFYYSIIINNKQIKYLRVINVCLHRVYLLPPMFFIGLCMETPVVQGSVSMFLTQLSRDIFHWTSKDILQ